MATSGFADRTIPFLLGYRVKDSLTLAQGRRSLALVTQPGDVYRFSSGASRAVLGAWLTGKTTRMSRLITDRHDER
ncbi:hypothetical protein CHELA1G11_10548 [Hyphomicrobiales bacterium]|nr:hypothetical protein CHELA1G11_10548 [Hyphomicrobiales bacterium]CAH1673901.1 hypothetical protein CHELA1G2_13755 [Hyphomicrobiales bacterium]